MTPTIRKTSRTLIENVKDSLCDAPSIVHEKYSKSTNYNSPNNTQTNHYTRTEDAPLRVRTSYSTRPVERIARESIDASRDGRDVRIRTRDGRLSGFNTHGRRRQVGTTTTRVTTTRDATMDVCVDDDERRVGHSVRTHATACPGRRPTRDFHLNSNERTRRNERTNGGSVSGRRTDDG